MEFLVNDIDSEVFGKVVGDIKGFDNSVNFKEFEQSYVDKHNPFYVLAKISSKDLESVHILEESGFKFIEMQIKNKSRIKKMDIPISGYNISIVDNEKDLDDVIKIAKTTFEDDRLVVDKELLSFFDENLASKRYETYVRRSYMLDNQFLYKVYEEDTGKTVAFFSFMLLDNNEALSFLEGVDEGLKGEGIGGIYTSLYRNELVRLKVKTMYGAFSGRNFNVMNLGFGLINLKIVDSFVVLRKIYR